jgi:tetratricopeptide (TPR) repeat protein
MNLRLLSAPILALFVVPCASGLMICSTGSESLPPALAAANFIVPAATVGCGTARFKSGDSTGRMLQPVIEIPDRAELLRRIGVYEAALRGPEAARTKDDVLAKAYARLASLYDDAAMPARAEAALTHAISLSRGNKEWSGQLATELSDLGLMHAEQDKLRDAEKEELEALSIRGSLGDSLEIARSWNSLSGLYFKERKYAAAREFARRAMVEFSVDQQADVIDGITSRLNLSVAMCYLKDCPAAVPLLKEVINMAKSSFKSTDFPVGEGKFLLGFAYWKSGDVTQASEYMQEGTTIMREQLGWGHPTYLNALGHYARFLRENRRGGEAEVVERQIRQAEMVVDVRSMPARGGVDSLAGLR